MTMGLTLQGLIRDGVIVLYHDYRFGHIQDLSGNGNHGTFATSCVWEGWGVKFPANNARITVSDAAELQLTELTLLVFGNFQSQTATECLISKSDAGGTNYEMNINATQVELYDGTNTRTRNVSVLAKKCLAINAANSEIASLYVDGLSDGAFDAASDISVNDAALLIGDYFTGGRPPKSNIEAVIICNRKLTATEHSQLYADLVNQTYPLKYFSFRKRIQYPNQNESGIVAGFPMSIQDNTVLDVISGNNCAVAGNPGILRSILGDGIKFDGSDDKLTCGAAQAAMASNSQTISVWARCFDKTAPALQGLVTNGSTGNDRQVLYIESSVMRYSVYGDSAIRTLTSAVVDNKLHHWVATRYYDGIETTITLYKDGESMGTTTFTGAVDVTQTACIIGFLNVTRYWNGEIVGSPELYTEAKSAAWVARKYAEGAKAVQLKTDYGYQETPTNEGGTLGQIIGGKSSPLRAGETSGRWAIETDTINGKLCKVLVCKTAGYLYIPTDYLFDINNYKVEAAFGTGSFWFYKADASFIRVSFTSDSIGATPQNGYTIYLDNQERLAIYRFTGGVIVSTLMLTAAGAFSVNTWTKCTRTRSTTGVFTAYLDDIAVTAATGANPSFADLTHTTSNYTLIDMDAGDKLCLDDLSGQYTFMKQLGVVAP